MLSHYDELKIIQQETSILVDRPCETIGVASEPFLISLFYIISQKKNQHEWNDRFYLLQYDLSNGFNRSIYRYHPSKIECMVVLLSFTIGPKGEYDSSDWLEFRNWDPCQFRIVTIKLVHLQYICSIIDHISSYSSFNCYYIVCYCHHGDGYSMFSAMWSMCT